MILICKLLNFNIFLRLQKKYKKEKKRRRKIVKESGREKLRERERRLTHTQTNKHIMYGILSGI